MIRGLVDFALNNRFLVVVIAILLFAWGVISFRSLPIEAYPDVANNYVQVITKWPGRAAEEVFGCSPVDRYRGGAAALDGLRHVDGVDRVASAAGADFRRYGRWRAGGCHPRHDLPHPIRIAQQVGAAFGLFRHGGHGAAEV